MSAIAPIRSVADKYARMEADDIGKLGSKGYGRQRFDEFISDVRELARLAKITERLYAEGKLR